MFVIFTLVFISSVETAIAAAVIKITEKLFVRGAGLRTRSAALTFLLCFQPVVVLLTLICRKIKPNKIIRAMTENISVVKINLSVSENIAFSNQTDVIRAQNIENVIAYIWLFITVLFILRDLLKYFRFRLLMKKSFSHEIGSSVSGIKIIVSSMVNSPFLMGILKPVIILPETEFTENELSMIIHHETIHYRRHDILRKIFAVFLRSINWFDPVFYVLEKKIGDVSELVADEIFTADMTRSERKEYGNMLLRFAENQSVHTNAYLSGNAIKLAKRLELIMKMKNSSNKKIRKAVIVPVAVIATAVIGIGTAAAVKALPNKSIFNIPLEKRPVIMVNGNPQDPVSGFSEIRDVGTKLSADTLKPETTELQTLANNMYAVEADQSDKKYLVENIAYGNGQVIVLCENDERGFLFEKDQNGVIEISADFSPWYAADGSTGELLEVGYIYDGIAEKLYFGRVNDEGLSVSFTADNAGEYRFYIINCSAGMQNYSYISVEKQ